jgi:chromosome segregation ATPase
MGNLRFSKSVFLLAISATLLSFEASGASDIPSSIRLPGIYSSWKTEGSDDKPEITMDEIERCVGKDVKIRQQYDGFNTESVRLEKAAGELEQLTKGINVEREAIENEAKTLNTDTEAINIRTAKFDKQNNELVDLTKKKMSAEAAKSANARIDAHNAQVKAHNADLMLLKERVRLFQEKQQRFNTRLMPIKEKLESFNALAEEFKVRKMEFDDLLLSYKSNCIGERNIVK